MKNVLQPKVAEKLKTHILYSLIFLPENRAFYEIMWGKKKFVERGQATDDNMAHAHCMLDT